MGEKVSFVARKNILTWYTFSFANYFLEWKALYENNEIEIKKKKMKKAKVQNIFYALAPQIAVLDSPITAENW